MKNKKVKAFKFEFKDMDTKGRFTGYSSVFDNIDSYKDIVRKGAFKRTLDHNKGVVPILWQHNSRQPIGIGISAKEDKNGLLVEGEINQDVQQGVEARSLIMQGAIKGLSIGYSVVKDSWDSKKGIRDLLEVKLWEYSPVTFPANQLAGINDIKDYSGSDLYELVKELKETDEEGFKALLDDIECQELGLKYSDSDLSSLYEEIKDMQSFLMKG